MTDGSGAFAPRAGHVAGASTGSPRGVAYVALLACSTLGTLASTLLSAPINVIARALAASPRGIVLAVSAFTLAMVVCAPLVGWMCQRFGSRVVLSGSLALMAAAQLGAALTQSLHFLVLMRVLQGIACSAIPPAVQQVLGHHWADRKVRVMAAWATAIGLTRWGGVRSSSPTPASASSCSSSRSPSCLPFPGWTPSSTFAA
jgi:MFS family permease